jgi:phosphate starvation-inducible membrane PsiE
MASWFLASMALNASFNEIIKMALIVLSFMLMMVAINEARIIAEDATNNTHIDNLISITYSVMMWYFLFITSIYLVIKMFQMVENVKKRPNPNT